MIEYTKRADIVVVATGIPGLITPDIIKEGACIIDVGINRVKDPKTGKTRLVGDCDFEGKCRDAFGLRHWANGAEKLPRAHFSENNAPVMAHCFPFGRSFLKWMRPTFHMFFIIFENIVSLLLCQLVFLSIMCTMQVGQRQGK